MIGQGTAKSSSGHSARASLLSIRKTDRTIKIEGKDKVTSVQKHSVGGASSERSLVCAMKAILCPLSSAQMCLSGHSCLLTLLFLSLCQLPLSSCNSLSLSHLVPSLHLPSSLREPASHFWIRSFILCILQTPVVP